MSWQIQVSLDADSADVGTVTATWTEKTGEIFTYSVRSNRSDADNQIARAIIARDEWQKKNTLNAQSAADLLTAMNAADPQGVK